VSIYRHSSQRADLISDFETSQSQFGCKISALFKTAAPARLPASFHSTAIKVKAGLKLRPAKNICPRVRGPLI
jgi:hypothetical protein